MTLTAQNAAPLIHFNAYRGLTVHITVVVRELLHKVHAGGIDFDRDDLSRELEASGFEVEEVLGDVAGRPFDPSASELAIVGRKPGGPPLG